MKTFGEYIGKFFAFVLDLLCNPDYGDWDE